MNLVKANEISTGGLHQLPILQSVPLPVSVIDRQCCFSFANEAFLRHFHLEPQHLLGKDIREVFGCKSGTGSLPLPSPDNIIQFFFSAGNKVCLLHYFPVCDDAGNLQAYVSYEQPQDAPPVELVKETNLKDTENRYLRMIAEVQDYAIILLDIHGNILDWNNGACRIKGYEASEIVGKNFRVFYSAEDQQRQLPERLLQLAYDTGKASHEGWRIKKDGSKFWASIVITALHDDLGEVIGYCKLTRDLTDKKLAEEERERYAHAITIKNEELRRSEERYHRMIAEVEDYAIILLDVKGNIQNWNKGAERIKGYAAAEIIGNNFSVFYPEEYLKQGLPQQLIQQATTEGKACHEGWRLRKNGQRFWGSVVITALHDHAGKLIGFSKVTRDLTERKLAEDRQKRAAEQLEAQNKELEQFAYVASHDLQEPLRKIRTFNSLILEQSGHQLPPKAAEYFQRSIDAAERMYQLIDDLLSYSRATRETSTPEAVDLHELIQTIQASFRGEGVVIHADALPVLPGLRFHFEQVFNNLISNAVKYQAAGNKPVIRIRYELVSGQQVKGKLAGSTSDFHHISVQDNGIGFDPVYAEKIFEMFHRLHGRSEYAGSGIGLAIVKRIIQHQGGSIIAESEPGKGSIFHLYWPILK